jgi:hypothetical protein
MVARNKRTKPGNSVPLEQLTVGGNGTGEPGTGTDEYTGSGTGVGNGNGGGSTTGTADNPNGEPENAQDILIGLELSPGPNNARKSRGRPRGSSNGSGTTKRGSSRKNTTADNKKAAREFAKSILDTLDGILIVTVDENAASGPIERTMIEEPLAEMLAASDTMARVSNVGNPVMLGAGLLMWGMKIKMVWDAKHRNVANTPAPAKRGMLSGLFSRKGSPVAQPVTQPEPQNGYVPPMDNEIGTSGNVFTPHPMAATRHDATGPLPELGPIPGIEPLFSNG